MDDIEPCNDIKVFISCGNKVARASDEALKLCACLPGVDPIPAKSANMVFESPGRANAVPTDLSVRASGNGMQYLP